MNDVKTIYNQLRNKMKYRNTEMNDGKTIYNQLRNIVTQR